MINFGIMFEPDEGRFENDEINGKGVYYSLNGERKEKEISKIMNKMDGI